MQHHLLFELILKLYPFLSVLSTMKDSGSSKDVASGCLWFGACLLPSHSSNCCPYCVVLYRFESCLHLCYSEKNSHVILYALLHLFKDTNLIINGCLSQPMHHILFGGCVIVSHGGLIPHQSVLSSVRLLVPLFVTRHRTLDIQSQCV